MFLSPCFSARLKRSARDPVPYCKEALRQDLTRVQIAWDECQSSRERDAIYSYLTAVALPGPTSTEPMRRVQSGCDLAARLIFWWARRRGKLTYALVFGFYNK